MLSQRTWVKLRHLLWPASLLYWGLAWWRNFFYNIGFFFTRRVPAAVVSIGNLSVGGTGKTPAAIFIAQYMLNLGYRVGVVSRGYRRQSSGTVIISDGKSILATPEEAGDEPYLIASRLPNVPVVVDENRFRGAMTVVKEYAPEILILDDAFQHRGLFRDCDIVLLDASAPLEEYHLFPYGTLREHFGALKRANLIIWTRTNSQKPPPKLEARIVQLGIPHINSRMEVSRQLVDITTGGMIPCEQLRGKPLLAVCGIAQPMTFYNALMSLGLEPESVRYYPDHHRYISQDLAYLSELTENNRLAVITTEKDAVKLDSDFLAGHRVYAVRIEFQLTGQDLKIFQDTLMQYLPLPQITTTPGEA